MQVISPKLIFYKYGNSRVCQIQELFNPVRRIEGQITNDICPIVILTNLISRRREESKQYFILRMFRLDLLHHRTALFELAQGGSMKPDIFCIPVDLLTKNGIRPPLPQTHDPGLFMEWRYQRNDKCVKVDCQTIHNLFKHFNRSFDTANRFFFS